MSIEIKNSLNQIEDFIKRLSSFSDSPKEYSLFLSLVRSSIIKNYEFLKVVCLEDEFDGYFFATSFLRGIVEDIIVLESVHCIPSEKREKLLRGMHLLEVNERIIRQWDFFEKYRPFQPVISKAYPLEDTAMEVQSIWREIGWPKFEVKPKSLMPATIQLAQKLAPGILDILYEFIYRLSSSTVHFSPQTLLRMGWGTINNENSLSGTISVNHMANYHKTFCQIYGALLFSFYFEFFSDEINATETEQKIIEDIRKIILKEFRWPEMITFEEMNQPVPEAYHNQIITYGLIHQAIIEIQKSGFVKNDYEKFFELVKKQNTE